jgi:hypothetical protein
LTEQQKPVEEPDLLSNFNETQLLPILEAAVGVPIASLSGITPLGVEGGYSGGSTHLSTFSYTTRDGRPGEVTLFVKRCAWKRRSEAVHYRHLAAHGVPTPRLYGALHNDSGEEIIFLEPLTTTGSRCDSETEWRGMLSLMARLNTCAITPDYAPHLHRFEQVGRIAGTWILGLDASPTNEEVEASLRACDVRESELPALLQAARALFARVAAQPQGLLHQDFLPHNLGWRGDREEMLVFDLHKNARGPRFADAAVYLALPDWSDSAAFLDHVEHGTVSRRQRLIQHYLDEVARFGGPTVPPLTFHEETAALSWSHKVATLPWLADQKQQTRIREVLDFLRQVPLNAR